MLNPSTLGPLRRVVWLVVFVSVISLVWKAFVYLENPTGLPRARDWGLLFMGQTAAAANPTASGWANRQVTYLVKKLLTNGTVGVRKAGTRESCRKFKAAFFAQSYIEGKMLFLGTLSQVTLWIAALIWLQIWKEVTRETAKTWGFTKWQSKFWQPKNLLYAQIKCLAVRSSAPHEMKDWHWTGHEPCK